MCVCVYLPLSNQVGSVPHVGIPNSPAVRVPNSLGFAKLLF